MEIGDRFNRLVFIEDLGSRPVGQKGRVTRWGLFQCDCGNMKEMRLENIKTGHAKSCGCWMIEKSTKHGMSNHKLRSHYNAMHQRCTNPKNTHYEDYGGRGVKIFNEWLSDISSFYKWALDNGWQKGLELDRIDNDGNYEPNNCQWITHKENNSAWKKRAKKGTASGFVGVVFHIKTNSWHAMLRNGDKTESLKYHKTIEEAVEYRLKREIEVFGEQKSNFHYNEQDYKKD